MARTIYDFLIEKNSVIIHYAPGHNRPSGCVARYLGFYIKTSIYMKGFEVYKSAGDKCCHFDNLRDTRKFIINEFNKSNSLFV